MPPGIQDLKFKGYKHVNKIQNSVFDVLQQLDSRYCDR